MKRFFLFVLVNVLVVATISIVLAVLGVQPYLSAQGIDYTSLAIFALVWGFGGAFVSLALSRIMAKWMMGVKLVEPGSGSDDARWLVDTVYRLARKAGLQTMPEVGIYDGPELNAFATGPTRNRALVAVSTGLLANMNKDEIEGVLGHEISHVANGDMVTMTLLQGVVNAFVIFLARVAAFAVTNMLRGNGDRDRGGNDYWIRYGITLLFEIVLSFLGMIVVAGFSRWREYRADEGGARLAGKGRMIGALAALKRNYQVESPMGREPATVATLKISKRRPVGGLGALFSTHPPLEERIAALEAKSIV